MIEYKKLNDGGYKLIISEEMTIRTIEKLHRQSQICLTLSKWIIFDLTKVDEIDTAGIQLLYAIRSSAIKKDKHISIMVNQLVYNAVELLNMKSALNMDLYKKD
jgi:ABC-type transporter Mla MlaB component